ncbi:Protein of unknown function [Pyronema omphalodes CBS 100304]|uniref:Uncharacterized protein n=1 Tax=Pyronema omphalodes (strain CBS 100304) TaxID=1076935 RepID=U4LJH5_PYROM|nr:Protein of unknown function [Pyronema omphalodes CBS 100304]
MQKAKFKPSPGSLTEQRRRGSEDWTPAACMIWKLRQGFSEWSAHFIGC